MVLGDGNMRHRFADAAVLTGGYRQFNEFNEPGIRIFRAAAHPPSRPNRHQRNTKTKLAERECT